MSNDHSIQKAALFNNTFIRLIINLVANPIKINGFKD